MRDKPTAPASPWQNGFAERLIGSIRRECVDHIIVLGEVHLRQYEDPSLPEQGCSYLASYSANRKHQITRHPWRTSPPLRQSLSFRYTQGHGGNADPCCVCSCTESECGSLNTTPGRCARNQPERRQRARPQGESSLELNFGPIGAFSRGGRARWIGRPLMSTAGSRSRTRTARCPRRVKSADGERSGSARLRHANCIERCPLSGVTRKTFAQIEFFRLDP
ncbi:MAG: hypothetical protein WBF73_15105 [Bradyrhizobium sp.]